MAGGHGRTAESDRGGRRWYRGDCHVHSLASHGGELTPEQVVGEARAAGLDFLVATEHNTAESHTAWVDCADEDLLVVLGQEVMTPTGHWLALGLAPGQVVDWRYRAGDGAVERYLVQVHEAGGLCVAAHPQAPYPSGTFMFRYEGFDAVEVWNGQWESELPWNADNPAALAEWSRGLPAGISSGRWRPAVGNSDTHLTGQIGAPHTVVLADELRADAVLAGIRAGRCWIAESPSIDLMVRAAAGGCEAGIGDRLAARGETAVVRADVRGVPSGVVSFHTACGTVHHAELPATGSDIVHWDANADESGFVRVEVRHAGGRMAALSNPIVLI